MADCEVPCNPLQGYCDTNPLGNVTCSCFAGFSGVSCDVSIAHKSWMMENFTMAFLSALLLFKAFRILHKGLHQAKLTRRRIVLMSCASLFASLSYGLINFILAIVVPTGGSRSVWFLIGYWCYGLFFCVCFFIHAQCLSVYYVLLNSRFDRIRGYVSMTRLPVVGSIIAFAVVEFFLSGIYVTLARYDKLPFSAGEKTDMKIRHSIRSAMMAFVVIVLEMTVFYFWKRVVPEQSILREHSHPGFEVDQRVLRRIDVYMMWFMVINLLCVFVLWFDVFWWIFREPNESYNLTIYFLRDFFFLSQLAGILWAFGEDPDSVHGRRGEVVDYPSVDSIQNKLTLPPFKPRKRSEGTSSSSSHTEESYDDDESEQGYFGSVRATDFYRSF